MKAVVKPQYVDQIPRAVKGPVKEVGPLIEARSQMDNMEHIMDVLGNTHFTVATRSNTILTVCTELKQVENRDINLLSGGELQRFALALVCVQQADV